MTKQDYYNMIEEAFNKGNLPCRNASDACTYLREDGAKCVAGMLIKPDKYNKAMEGCTIDNVIYEFGENILETVDDVSLKQIKSLQTLHDIDFHRETFLAQVQLILKME